MFVGRFSYMTDAIRHSFQNGALGTFITTKRYLGPHLLLEKGELQLNIETTDSYIRQTSCSCYFLGIEEEDGKNVA